ncbi:hypothetical protein [Staphylococcus gallinarum]|uniref:hypothetical protein n=1 Tax=Staphylococcus gallinarum TaxID=1293 RepID=UPI0031778F40
MTVEIKGITELQRELEKRYGKEAMLRKSDKALVEASDYFVNELKNKFETFKDTGASIDEMHRSSPYTDKRSHERAIKISWIGPHERYRIIHLNEHGYDRDGKKITPKGFAVIEKTLVASRQKYRDIVIKELRKNL